MIDRIPVKSSVLDCFSYDEETGDLKVWFNSGAVYTYKDVPQAAYEAMLTADSVGSYFMRHIRQRYQARKERE